MQRRALIKIAAAAAVPGPAAGAAASPSARVEPVTGCGDAVIWKTIVPALPGAPSLSGHTDTVPDVVGRLGSPINLAIFTEGNHFPVLLGGEVIEPFRIWAKSQPQYAPLGLDNIVVVTLPQPMIVGMLLGGGISFGNLTLEVSRASGFYPDVVMGGAAPLARLRNASIVEAEARIFARNRGLSLLVAAGNPFGVRGVEDLARSGIRVVMASENEPGARRQYIDALNALVGEEAAKSILAHETVTFAGRLGIQHRDVLYAITSRCADVGIIFHHLARYFAATYPQLCQMVTVREAEKFSSTIAMTSAVDPLRGQAAKAFREFFLGAAREVYPRYGFATLDTNEFGAAVSLD